MRIGIVRYNAGNISSLLSALNRLGVAAELCADPQRLQDYDRVIFPGVGEMSTAMRHLRERGLDQALRELRRPVLGICLGLQILCAHSEEGPAEGLGIFACEVQRFRIPRKVPHMGWNAVHSLQGPLFRGISSGANVYFVHSYRAAPGPNCIALCDYEEPFAAALQHENFYALQFHPEKSGAVGAQILKNFIEFNL